MKTPSLHETTRVVHLLKPCAGPEETALKFLLVYEDSETGFRAKQIMNHLAERGHGTETKPVMFRFELLRMKEIWELATRECQTVDVIIIASHDGGSVPVEVKSWITYWLGLKGGQPHTVIASFDRASLQSSEAEMTLFFLRSLAEWADVELKILFGDGPHPDLNPGRRLVLEHTEKTPAIPAEMTPRIFVGQAGRHWGLNE